MTSSVMAQACADLVAELGDDPNVVALAADGAHPLAAFATRHPDRYVDVGIAEANLVSVAAGLARVGRRVVVATMAPFLVRRAYEQLRVDVCQPGLPVTLLGVGGGFSYGRLGATHHAPEDVALLRAMPGTTVLVPADAREAAWAVRRAVAGDGPAYVRLGARACPDVHTACPDAALAAGGPVVVRRGEGSALVLACGEVVGEALVAAEALARRGRSLTIASVPLLEPAPVDAIRALARPYRSVVTVEEHLGTGGLGAIVADALGRDHGGQLHRLSAGHAPAPVGSRADLLRFHRIDAAAIEEAVDELEGAAAATTARHG